MGAGCDPPQGGAVYIPEIEPLNLPFIDFSSSIFLYPEFTAHTAVGLKNEFASRRA